MSLSTPTRILDRKDIPADPNAYVFRDAQRDGTWCLYFYDREVKTRHRIVLKDGNGKKPTQTIKGQNDAWMLGISKYVELKGKDQFYSASRDYAESLPLDLSSNQLVTSLSQQR